VANVVPCPAGTYSSNQYLTSVTQCVDCPPGKYCTIGSSIFSGYCNAGYICVGGQGVPNPTGVFDFSYTNSKSGPCPIGHYCPIGTTYPIPCPAGQYSPNTGAALCTNCDAGAFCEKQGLSAISG